MNEDQFKQLMEKMDVLTRTFAILSIKDIEDDNQKMWFLQAMGFSYPEIAQIVNKTKDAVRMALSRMRSDKSKSKGEEDE